MKLIRSWPALELPEGRAYVEDGIERFYNTAYDYRGLADYNDDILLLEWDIAVGGQEIAHFAEHAYRTPDDVLAAPYRLYRTKRYEHLWPEHDTVGWAWIMVDWLGREPDPDALGVPPPGEQLSGKQVGDQTANRVGFGMIYLPRKLIRKFCKAERGRLTDTSFSDWHYLNVRPDIPICWHVRPVHLHFDVPQMPARPKKEKKP